MFGIKPMYSRYGYAGKDEINRKVRDRTIELIFAPLNLVWQVTPALIVLNLCGVLNISWGIIIGVFAAYEIVNYLSDLLGLAIEQHDNKKQKKQWEEEARREAVKRMEEREEEEE